MFTVRRRLFILVIILLVAASGFAIDPANLNRVTFVNQTGYDIVYLFFSPGDSDQWGADILGTSRYLNDGEKLGFYIHYPEYSNTFDFLAIDADGDAYIIWDFEINDDSSAVVHVTFEDYEGGYDMPDLAEVQIQNITGYDIWYLFFSPGDSTMWGIDMLDDETILYDGETVSLFLPVGPDTIRYDLQAVDEDEDIYEFFVELSDSDLDYTFAVEISDLQ